MSDSWNSEPAELKRLLTNKDWQQVLRAAAALSLPSGAPPAPDKFQVLCDAVATGSVVPFMEVLNAIASHGGELAAPLMLQLARQNPDSRGPLRVLARIAPDLAVTYLAELNPENLMHHLSQGSTGDIAQALAQAHAPAAVKRFLSLLPRYPQLAEVLRTMNRKDVASELKERLGQDSSLLRNGGLRLLAHVAKSTAVPILVAALQHPLRGVREDAARALIECGPVCLPPVLELLPRDARVLEPALWVVSEFGDASAAPVLHALLPTTPETLKPKVLEVLVRIAGLESERLLKELVVSSSKRLRKASVNSLRHVPTESAISLLARVALESRELRQTALNTLLSVAERNSLVSDIALKAFVAVVSQAEPDDVALLIMQLAHSRPRDALREIDALISSTRPPENGLLLELRRGIAIEIDRTASDTSTAMHASGIAYMAAYRLDVRSEQEQVTQAPPGLEDDCYFSVIAPEHVATAQPFILEVRCAPGPPSDSEWSRLRPGAGMRTRGPVAIKSNVVLSVFISIPQFTVSDNESPLLWRDREGIVGFQVTPNPDINQGTHIGVARVSLNGMAIASIYFSVEVAAKPGDVADCTSNVRKVGSAFASYASEDRREVLTRIQGMQKILPSLDVFLDVLTLRSGDMWQQRIDEEILHRDVFFLFWSKAASTSRWVEYEWRRAFSARGVTFIDPVPLEPPSVAPVPEELSSLHFNDWTLNVGRPRS